MNVEDNLMSIIEIIEKDKSKHQIILENLLNEFDINHVRKSRSIVLSGGERRRLEIARTLASKPQFLLLDEPFAGIDPIAVSDLKKTIGSLNDSGFGILISDHNVRDTMQICHKVLIMSEGKIVAEGSPDDVKNKEKVKEVYLGKDFSA